MISIPLHADEAVIEWLLAGDVSIQHQVRSDLFGDERPDLQSRIASEGWGARFLAARNPDGTWGRGFYQPKWTSSHYTLLDLRNLGIGPDQPIIRKSIEQIVEMPRGRDGGVYPIGGDRCDACVNGMFLNYACYFGAEAERLQSVVDFLLAQQMPDGGFNCQKNRRGARHSSLHSTLSILEGIEEYLRNGYRYEADALAAMAEQSRAFILQHRFFRSDRTGEIIKPEFLRFVHPPRWRYNILRALDHFRHADAAWAERMREAVEVVRTKRRKDGRWVAHAGHPGAVHFTMEKAGAPSRWTTLIALRVLQRYGGYA